MSPTPRTAVILGSTRPDRNCAAVADWFIEIASERSELELNIVDLAEVALPFLDEPLSARATAMMKLSYTHEHTRAWSDVIAAYDAFVFVVPEYNRSIPAVLKNALDFLYAEWANKPAAIVSYGAQGGARASAQLRQILGELHVPTIATELNLMLYTDFENFTEFKPASTHRSTVDFLIEQLSVWTGAMQSVRFS